MSGDKAPKKAPKSPFGPPLDISAAFAARPVLDFVLPGFLSGSTGVVIAPGSTGKSLLALQTAASVALGRDAFGIFRADLNEPETMIKSGRVVIINVEDQAPIISDRLYSMGPAFTEEEKKAIHEDVLIFSEVGRNFRLVQPNEMGPGFRMSDAMHTTIEYLKWIQPRLVIFDTMNRLSAGVDENSNADMGLVMSFIEELNLQVGCSSLIIHHANKGAVLSGNSDSQQAGRGASAVTDNARWQINLSTMTKEEAQNLGYSDLSRRSWVRMDYSKVNYGPPRPTVWMRREEGGWMNGNVPSPEEVAEEMGLTPSKKQSFKKKKSPI